LDSRTYLSTNLRSEAASFREALLKGLAPDGGLYMPSSLPIISREKLTEFGSMHYFEIAFILLNSLFGNEIDGQDLLEICKDAYYFNVPLDKVFDRKYIVRLDEGPTASFKDFAARMMSRLMQHFLAATGEHLTILTATSGDTGSAVASAFHGMKNIKVIILFPEEEVTLMQRKQMTTLQDNISVISLDGKFDDCQRLVKKSFTDQALSAIPLSSANSINIGRLLPQAVYYFYSWSRVARDAGEKAIFSVPSGNFGNLMGGLIAREMGLPVKKFIIATNANKEVPEFLDTGIYRSISPSINCISSAMNVGHPSNLARIIALYGGIMDETGMIVREPDLVKMHSDLYGISITDEETRKTIYGVYDKYGILLEPHGAVAWRGMTEYLRNASDANSKQLCLSLETAHPAKFPEELKGILDLDPPLPPSLEGVAKKNESFVRLENNYEMLRDFILRQS
jgi:threonine synthase